MEATWSDSYVTKNRSVKNSNYRKTTRNRGKEKRKEGKKRSKSNQNISIDY